MCMIIISYNYWTYLYIIYGEISINYNLTYYFFVIFFCDLNIITLLEDNYEYVEIEVETRE